MDQVSSGALSTPWQTGSQANGTEPGRPAAPQAEWLDVAVLYRQHHADLVRLALLLVGDRGCAEDVVQDVFTRLCARDRALQQDSTLRQPFTTAVRT